MTKTETQIDRAEPEFGAGTVISDSPGYDPRAFVAQADTMANAGRHVTETKTTLPCGTVLTSVQGVDLRFRIVDDRRDHNASEAVD